MSNLDTLVEREEKDLDNVLNNVLDGRFGEYGTTRQPISRRGIPADSNDSLTCNEESAE